MCRCNGQNGCSALGYYGYLAITLAGSRQYSVTAKTQLLYSLAKLTSKALLLSSFVVFSSCRGGHLDLRK